MLLLVVQVIAYCPPCHQSFRRHSYNLLEKSAGRPWGVMVPPAPNAPLTACGCGGLKETPRDELRKMPKPEIASKIRGLDKDVSQLEGAIDEAKDEHKSTIEDLEAKLEELNKEDKDQRVEIAKKAGEREGDRTKIKDQSDKDFEEIQTINEELGSLRERNKQVHEDMTIRLMDMEMCGCKSKLLQTSTMLKQMEMPDGYEDILKFEKLEAQKGKLMDEQSEEQREYGEKYRALTHRIDLVKAKMNRQDIQADKYSHTDKRQHKMVKYQAEAMGTYLEKKQAQVKRMKEDVAKNEETYKELETEMGKCGCGPKGR